MRHHWFIGDIHGCYESLRRLEDKLGRASERAGADPYFVSVGDLVDRGPDSAAVVRHFREGSAAGTHTAILGNHEEMMLRCIHSAVPEVFGDAGLSRWVATGELYRSGSPRQTWLSDAEFQMLGRLMWLSQGGNPTLASFGIDPHSPARWLLPEDDLDWLNQLPVVFECDSAVATHALVTAELLEYLIIADQAEGSMSVDLRDAVSRALWLRSLPNAPPDERVHVSGHTPLSRVRRYESRRLVRVDTGCYLGWRLSAWSPELDRVISVKGPS